MRNRRRGESDGLPVQTVPYFVDANGVRWGVEARVLGEDTDAIPVGPLGRGRGRDRVHVSAGERQRRPPRR